jgi:inorganic pyrophosphatase
MTQVLARLPSRAKNGLVNVIVDTPKGSRNKFKFAQDARCFTLSRILPRGASFPYDFGSIPNTMCEDGDALDVVLLYDEPSFVGCLVVAKLIGGIAGQQTEHGATIDNDRLLAVPVTSVNPARFEHIAEVSEDVLRELEHFFVSYNEAQGRIFTPTARLDPAQADARLVDAERRYHHVTR